MLITESIADVLISSSPVIKSFKCCGDSSTDKSLSQLIIVIKWYAVFADRERESKRVWFEVAGAGRWLFSPCRLSECLWLVIQMILMPPVYFELLAFKRWKWELINPCLWFEKSVLWEGIIRSYLVREERSSLTAKVKGCDLGLQFTYMWIVVYTLYVEIS